MESDTSSQKKYSLDDALAIGGPVGRVFRSLERFETMHERERLAKVNPEMRKEAIQDFFGAMANYEAMLARFPEVADGLPKIFRERVEAARKILDTKYSFF